MLSKRILDSLFLFFSLAPLWLGGGGLLSPAQAQNYLLGTGADGQLTGYALVQRGDSVQIDSVGQISTTKRVGYLFGQFVGGPERELLRVMRSGRRHFSFRVMDESGQLHTRRIRLSKAVGELCYLMTGFNIDGKGSMDLAIVDVSSDHLYRWFIIDNPLQENFRERESFRLGYKGERIEWVKSKGRGIEFVSLRQSFDRRRVRLMLRSALEKKVRIIRAMWDSPSGLLLPVRFQDSHLFDPGIGMYSPALASLYMFDLEEKLVRYELPQNRCQGFQAITNLSRQGAVETVEICSDGSYILARRGEQPGAVADSVRSSGALPESVTRLRLAELTRLQTQGEAPMPVVNPGSSGEEAQDPAPGSFFQPFPTSTPQPTPTNTPTPTATPSGLSIEGAPAISVGIVRSLKLFKRIGGASSELTAQASWSSSDPSVATIDASGRVTGVSAGSVSISASVGVDSVSKTFAVAQAGSLHSGFNQGSLLSLAFRQGSGNDRGEAVVITPQDEILVLVSLAGDIGLMKFNSSGALVASFGDQGRVLINLGQYEHGNSIIEHNGKYLIAGFTGPSLLGDGLIIRINEDGTLDPTFGTNGVVTVDAGGTADGFYGVRVGADGMIYAAGSRNDGERGFLARLNQQGALDPSFDGDGIVLGSLAGEFAYATALADNKVVVGAYTPLWPPDPAIVRYLPNGAPDTTFGVNGYSRRSLSTNDDKVRSLMVDSQGRYLAAGWHVRVFNSSSKSDGCVIRWLSSGVPDTTFGVGDYRCIPFGGFEGDEQVRNIFDGGDDTIIALGSGTGSASSSVKSSGVARLQSNGSFDPNFATSGIWMESGITGGNELRGGAINPRTGVMYFVGQVNNGASGDDVLLVALNS
ncbi:MAG: Ig-like domain-containing protein [Pseudomonadota bacterium]